MDVCNESLKYDKINRYKALIKIKKRHCINRKQENILHLSMLDPKKFWRKIMTCKTKENVMISLIDYNSYLKSIYESHNVLNKISKFSTKDDVFLIEDIKFGVKRLANRKDKDIKGYQDEILKVGGPIIIPHMHNLFNLAIKQGFPKPWTQSLILPIFKSGDKSNPFNYRTIIISLILAKLYISILEKKNQHMARNPWKKS